MTIIFLFHLRAFFALFAFFSWWFQWCFWWESSPGHTRFMWHVILATIRLGHLSPLSGRHPRHLRCELFHDISLGRPRSCPSSAAAEMFAPDDFFYLQRWPLYEGRNSGGGQRACIWKYCIMPWEQITLNLKHVWSNSTFGRELLGITLFILNWTSFLAGSCRILWRFVTFIFKYKLDKLDTMTLYSYQLKI